MIRGTTPTLTLTITNGDGLNLTLMSDIYVTIKQGRGRPVTKTGEALEVEANAVRVWLNQEESLRLTEGDAEVQLNWKYIDATDGTERRGATKVKTIKIDRQLLERVV